MPTNYLYRDLPSYIQKNLKFYLNDFFGISELPNAVECKTSKVFAWHVPTVVNQSNFCIKFNLKTEEIIPSYGSINGHYSHAAVDVDQKRREIGLNEVIIKGSVKYDKSNKKPSLQYLEVIFHYSQMPKTFPYLSLSDRERQIIFCFAVLKEGLARREALCKLNVDSTEIEPLLARGLLKKMGSGYIITKLAETNKSSNKIHDMW